MRVLAIDPGLTTGIAIIAPEGVRYKVLFHTEFLWGSDPHACGDEPVVSATILFRVISQLVHEYAITAVVIERWIGGSGGKLQSITNMIIGASIAAASIELCTCVTQYNAERRAAMPEAKKLVPAKYKHARDAAAHAITYLEKHNAKNYH